jgi:hypothetical protein
MELAPLKRLSHMVRLGKYLASLIAGAMVDIDPVTTDQYG